MVSSFSFRCTALVLIATLWIPLAPRAWASADLTGVWSSPSGRLYRIQQNGAAITADFYQPVNPACTHDGIVPQEQAPGAPTSQRSFEGTLGGSHLTGRLTSCNLPTAQWKTWALDLTVSSDGNELTGTFGSGGNDTASVHFVRERNPPAPTATSTPTPTATSTPVPTATPKPEPTPTVEPTVTVTDASVQADGTLGIDDAGTAGTYTSPSGNILVVIPPGAGLGGRGLYIVALDSSGLSGLEPDGYQLAGTEFFLNDSSTSASRDTFRLPVLVGARPTASDLVSAGGDPTSLAWAAFDLETGNWTILPTEIDGDGLIVARVDQPTLLVLLAPARGD